MQIRCTLYIQRKIMFVLLILGTAAFAVQASTTDSLLKVLQTLPADTNRIDILGKLTRQLLYSDKKQAEAYAMEIVSLGKKFKSKIHESSGWNRMGIISYYHDDYIKAIAFYEKSLSVLGPDADKKTIADRSRNIGLCFDQIGNYSQGIACFFRALKLSEELADSTMITNLTTHIGNVYFHMRDHENSMLYYHKACEISLKRRDEGNTAISLNNIGSVYSRLSQKDSAVKYFTMSLELRKKLHDSVRLVTSYSNLSSIEGDRNNHKMALTHALEAYKIADALHIKDALITASRQLAIVYFDLKNYSQALHFGKMALDYAEASGIKNQISESHMNLSETYEGMNDHAKALFHYKQHIQMKDSLMNEENTKFMTQQQMRYEFDKQQVADSIRNAEMLKQETLKHEQEVRQQRTYTFGGIIGFVLMLAVAIVSFRAFIQKKKANTIITAQKQLVEEKQREILDSIRYARRIQKSLLPTDKFIGKKLEDLNK